MSLLRKTLLRLSESDWLYRLINKHRFSRRMARRFIAGETLEDAIGAIRQINVAGMLATFDRLGENVTTRAESREAVQAYLHILEEITASDIQSNISLKLTELGLPISEDFCYENLREVVVAADRLNNFIRIDMEGSAYTEQTLQIFERLYRDTRNVGVVIQSYLYRSAADIAKLIQMQARVRLCKGAYHEPPTVAFPTKAEVDRNYVTLMKKLLLDGNYPALATHDPVIIRQGKDFARENRIDPARFEFQMLYGIQRELQRELVKEGYKVRIYVPYGEKWYPYFMRRLAERPANLIFFLTSLLRG